MARPRAPPAHGHREQRLDARSSASRSNCSLLSMWWYSDDFDRPGRARQVLHARAVVPAVGEHGDGDLQQRLGVVPASRGGLDGHSASAGTARAGAGATARRGTVPTTKCPSVSEALAAAFAPVAWKSENAADWFT